MNDTLTLALALMAGVLLGAVFYGGLWWTVRKALSSQRPAAWFVGSLLVRMSMILAGFHLVSGGHWERMAACLFGLVIARVLVIRFTGPPAERHNLPAKEAGHAP